MDLLQRLEDERAIRRVVDDLFHLTDEKRWDELAALFVEGPITIDMSSLDRHTGEEAEPEPFTTTGAELAAMWQKGLHQHKRSHHMTSNVLVDLEGDSARVSASGYALNALHMPNQSPKLWETWGYYTFTLSRAGEGWKILTLTYESQQTRGEESVRVHQL